MSVTYEVEEVVDGTNRWARVKVVDPKSVAIPEPLFETSDYYSFEGYFYESTTPSSQLGMPAQSDKYNCIAFDQEGKPAQSLVSLPFNPPTKLHAKWWQHINKERILYFLARFVRDSRAYGSQQEIDKYSQQISANPENWEAYVNRSFARFAKLWDDDKVRNFAKGCCLDVDNPILDIGKQPTTMPDGTVVTKVVPLSSLQAEMGTNQHIDEICGTALPIIKSAIDDLDMIPEDWADYVLISPENTGYTFRALMNYKMDCADVQMIKAILWELMSILELARGYNPHSSGSGQDGINRTALAAARDYYLNAVRSLSAFVVANKKRSGYDYNLFMIKLFQANEIEKHFQALFDLPWWTTEESLMFYAQNCWEHHYDLNPPWLNRILDEEKRAAAKEQYLKWVDDKTAESERKKNVLRGKSIYLSLRSLFEGRVSIKDGTFPLFSENHVRVDKQSGLTDPTCGGMFPEMTRKRLGELVEVFDSDLYEYDQNDIAVKYHAVLYKLQAGATNNLANPEAYTTNQLPIVLKNPTLEGLVFTGWSDRGVIPEGSAKPLTYAATFVPVPDDPVKYVTADGTVSECTNAVIVTADTATFEDGQWYFVLNTVERGSITVNGAAHLILCDGAKLTVSAVTNEAGIAVTSGNSLTIYGQELGTGELVAKNKWVSGGGGYAGACIGGVMNKGCGTVTINGGVITAIGEGAGAGIGGAWGGPCGSIIINGGKITARGLYGAGIGDGGYSSTSGMVTINGGTVDASHGYTAADIGVGWHGSGTTVTINGGSVKAETIQNAPTNGANAAVWCVTAKVEGLRVEKLRVEGLDNYGARDIYPIDGKVYLYLPDGTHYFTLSDGTTTQRYCAVVKGRAGTVEPLGPIGFFVNGVDIGGTGTGWTYDKDAKTLTLSDVGPYVLSGAATNDEVQVKVAASGATVVLSNAVVFTSGRPALDIAQNTSLQMAGGASTLGASDDAAITVGQGAALAVGLAPGVSGKETMVGVFNSGTACTIAGEGSVAVNGGTFFVWADRQAVGSAGGLAYGTGEVLTVGTSPETLRYATACHEEPCVLIEPGVTLTVAGIPHVTGFTVSNAVQRIDGLSCGGDGGMEYRILPGDDVFVYYTVEDSYMSQVSNPLAYSAINKDRTVDRTTIPIVLAPVPYRVWNETTRQMEDRTRDDYEIITADTATFEDGKWYFVRDTVSRGTITVNGAAHLILRDGTTLTVQNEGEGAGIAVEADHSLTIYGQALGTGELVAKGNPESDGGFCGAGIGGTIRKDCGAITINGGKVTAVGGWNGAGIGSGCFGAGGLVTIYGGQVVAEGRGEGAGIGSGWYGASGNTRIVGGTVVAKSGSDSTGHPFGSFSTVIVGGSVRAADCTVDPPVTNDANAAVYCVTAKVEKLKVEKLKVEGLDDYGTNDIYAVDGKVYLWLPDGTHHFSVSDGQATNRYRAVVNGGAVDAVPFVQSVPYRVWNEKTLQMEDCVCTDCTVVTAETRTFESDRWYVVLNPVECGSITVSGAAHLILCDGAKLTATGDDGRAGIEVAAGNALTIYGQSLGTGKLVATGGAGDIGPGQGASGGTVRIYGGIFARPLRDEWAAEGCAVGDNPDPATSADYPYTVIPAAFTVTIGDHPHLIVQRTYGNGSVTSLVTGTSFRLGTGQTGVSVIFTPEHGYRFVEEGETGVLALPSPVEADYPVETPAVVEIPCTMTFAVGEGISRAAYVCGGATNELVTGETVRTVQLGTRIELIVEELPLHYPFAGERTFTVEEETMRVEISACPIPKGMEGNPFRIGADVFAVTNAAGELTITGTGAMYDFASAADVPWEPATVTKVTIAESVTQIGANVWSGMGDPVVINVTALSAVRYLAPGVGSAQPAGAISGAEFAESVQIIDDKAYLGVAVYTNSEVKMRGEGGGWGVATNGVIVVPAPGKQGFFYLMSKPATSEMVPHSLIALPVFNPEIK